MLAKAQAQLWSHNGVYFTVLGSLSWIARWEPAPEHGHSSTLLSSALSLGIRR